MAKKPNPKPESVLFNVSYVDGSQTSNRRVPAELLRELDAQDQILAFLQKQDREIGERSGKPRAKIDTVEKAD